MRRFLFAACSLLLSALALVGGTAGAILCLHEAAIHVTAGAEGGDPACRDDSADTCDIQGQHECDSCVDVAVKGLDLAQLEDAAKLFPAPPVAITAITPEEWPIWSSSLIKTGPARAPPIKAQPLIVAETLVLLL